MKRRTLVYLLLILVGAVLAGGWWWARSAPEQATQFLVAGGLGSDRAEAVIALAGGVEIGRLEVAFLDEPSGGEVDAVFGADRHGAPAGALVDGAAATTRGAVTARGENDGEEGRQDEPHHGAAS